MAAYIVRRVALALVIMVGVSMIAFLLTRVIPSDPVGMWIGLRAKAEQREKARIELGLDKPLYVQYFRYMKGFVRGDWGTSLYTHQPVLRDIATHLPASLELILFGMSIALLVGIPLGTLSAARNGGVVDHLSRVFSLAGIALPTFWLAMIFQIVFFKHLHLFPLAGRIKAITGILHPIKHITGFNVFDSLVTGNFTAFGSAVAHIILPGITLAAHPLGLIARMTRATMLEVLGEDYIRTARACGISEVRVLLVYALRNALAPVLTICALLFAFSLVETFLIESVFTWPGLGFYASNAILTVDYPAIMGVTILISFTYILLNLIVDIGQAFLDPRIRVS